MNEPKKTEPITQENLPAALEDGRITQAEVDRIWGLTEFVSAETPIETRMLLVRAQEMGITLTPHEQLLTTLLFDLRALMTKDESKFAHLVAGTQSIVKTLQNLNPIMRHFERQQDMISSMADQLDRAETKIDNLLKALAEVLGSVGRTATESPVEEDEAAFLAKALDAPMIELTEEIYDGEVGSPWDEKNPVKGPIKLPTASAESEEQRRKWEEMMDRHPEITQTKEFRDRILKNS